MLLAEQEKTCCSFFSFTFGVDPPTVSLAVKVPTDAAAILDELATLATAT